MRILLIPFMLAAAFVPLVAARAQTKPQIDLIAGTVNGKPIAELSVDTITDLFGRPSATTDPEVIPSFEAGGHTFQGVNAGSCFVYGDLGLIFEFLHPRSDPQQRLGGIEVFLSQQIHKGTGTVMKPFSGVLSRGVNGTWKVKRVMEELAQFTPTDHYDPTRAEESRAYEEKGRALGVDPGDYSKFIISGMTVISMKTPYGFLSFDYEEHTKFLQRVSIKPRSPNSG